MLGVNQTRTRAKLQYRAVGVRSVVGHLLSLCFTALLLSLSFAVPGWWWLAYGALVPMGVLAGRSERFWTLVWCGFVVFLGWWLWQVRWLMPIGVSSWLGCAAAMAGYFTLGLLTLHWVVRRWKLPLTLALPLVWISMELIRSHFPAGGFGWFALGHSQAAYLPSQSPGLIVQVADLFGVHTVGLVVAMTNGLIVDLITRPLRARHDAHGQKASAFQQIIRAPALLWLIVFAAALGYGQWRLMNLGTIRSSTIRITVVQSNLAQNNARPTTKREDADNWRFLRRASLDAAGVRYPKARADKSPASKAPPDQSQTSQPLNSRPDDAEPAMINPRPRPDLIVWPESMVPAALNARAVDHHRQPWWKPFAFHQKVSRLVRQAGVDMIVGASALSDWKRVTQNGKVYERPLDKRNSAYHFLPNGRGGRGGRRYDKMHLVPFGEYVPGSTWFPWLKAAVLDWFSPWDFDYTLTPGDHPVVFKIPVGDGSRANPTATTERKAGKGPRGQGTGGPRRKRAKASRRQAAEGSGPTMIGVATPICFEDTVGRLCRRMIYHDGTKRADVLVNLTNDGWFPGIAEGYEHLQIATLRSIENRVPTARAVNSGVSGFISSSGAVGPLVSQDGKRQNVTGTATTTLQADPRIPLYALVGDWPLWTLPPITLLLVILGFKRRSEPS